MFSLEEIYIPDVKKFTFDLDIKTRNSKGEEIIKPPKTEDELAEMAQRDQVYERLFRKWEKREVDESEEESSEQEVDIREDFIAQSKYEKF
jgi:hypothetical protein